MQVRSGWPVPLEDSKLLYVRRTLSKRSGMEVNETSLKPANWKQMRGSTLNKTLHHRWEEKPVIGPWDPEENPNMSRDVFLSVSNVYIVCPFSEGIAP